MADPDRRSNVLGYVLGRVLNGPSIGQVLEEAGGWTFGFDYLRVILAALVIGWHSVITSYGREFEADVISSWLRPFASVILPMFFAMGGFLVTASLLRCRTFGEYLLLRTARFFPGLLGVVSVAALVVAPLLTSRPLSEYFLDSQFWRYWLNLIGDIQFLLPGVFTRNPAPGIVNLPLWTIPWEFGSSIALGLLFLFRKEWRSWIVLAVSIALSVSVPLIATYVLHVEPRLFGTPPGHLLALCLIPGACLYVFRHSVPLNFWLFCLSLVSTLIFLSRAKTAYFAPLPLAYFTIYLGTLHPPKYGLMNRADFSYGLYLYGFLIQQIYVEMFPAYRHWWLNWVVCLSLSFICAAGSWFLIEAPILKRKKQIAGRMSSWFAKPALHLARTARRDHRQHDRNSLNLPNSVSGLPPIFPFAGKKISNERDRPHSTNASSASD